MEKLLGTYSGRNLRGRRERSLGYLGVSKAPERIFDLLTISRQLLYESLMTDSEPSSDGPCPGTSLFELPHRIASNIGGSF
ncbi:hypothetical protein NPIL_280811 [Nephila pilipes]|uniref:Uncharacterized protein n=1 Tax=Nephila pilipes TaxID=299642 RepID=A0A8X6JYX8_NEPPI|nr:hypothetical protein NPIL_280811 [Nephila pilipes]